MDAKVIVSRILRSYIRPHRWRIVGALACMVVVAITTASNAYVMQPVLDEIFVNKDRAFLFWIPIIIASLAIIGGLANYGQTIIMRIVSQHCIATMQMDLYTHFIHSDLASFHDQSSGRMISRFTNDIQRMQHALANVLTGAAKESLSFIFLVGVMIYQSWQLSLFAIIIFPVAIWPVLRLGKRMRKVSHHTQQELGEFTNDLDEVFQGVRMVKAYGGEQKEISRASSRIWRLFEHYVKAARIQAAAGPLMETIGGLGIAGVIAYGGYQVLEGHTTPGGFFSFITAMLLAYKPIKATASLNMHLQDGIAAAARFFEAMDNTPTITDAADATALKITDGSIAFDNVFFAYNDERPALHDLSFTIEAGQTVAFVGSSGAGKSTVMNLLLRFYEIDSGSVCIDAQDIQRVTMHSLRESLALVSQDIVLFDTSVAENIAYGKSEISEEEIVAAAKAAHAHDFISALPQGYDTIIGPHGVTLSGGQRQRLSIARAILKDAPILLLDEATSALDSESEKAVQHALEKLMRHRTTLIIAHRLSTIQYADCIHVMQEGTIVESGTHTQLLDKNGAYTHLYYRQFNQSQADHSA